MFKLFSTLILILLVSTITFSQIDDRMIVNESDLPPDLVKELKQKKNQENSKSELENYAEYIGVGKEIGIAISEGLKAVVDEAEHFSETNVGLYTMALIAWAIVGNDIVQILIGVPLLLLGLFLILRYYRKTFLPQKRVIKSEGFFLWAKKEYEHKDAVVEIEDGATVLAIFFCTLLWVALCMMIIFI